MANDPERVKIALARAVAGRKTDPDQLSKATELLANIRPEIRGIDICIYGICLDYWLTPEQLRSDIQDIVNVSGAHNGNIRVFKYGIIDPDIYHIQSELDVPGISQGF